MRFTQSLQIVVLSLAGFGASMSGHCQVYTLSTPLSGYLTMSARDLNALGGAAGTFYLTFSNLTETVYLDPTNQTIRQVGVISATATASNFSIQETQSVPGQFPNPPSNVSGSITVSLAPTGADLAFDTGPRPLTWNPTSANYTFDGKLASLGNFVGSYSLTTGGQTYSGSFNYSLSLGTWYPAYAFRTLVTSGYPESLMLSGLGYDGDIAFCTVSPNVVADVVAENDFHMELSTGAWEYSGNYGEHLR